MIPPLPTDIASITVACNICGAAMHMEHAADEDPAIVAKCARLMACVNCIDRADSREKAERSAERLETRSATWETLCPFEFRKAIDWTKCNRAIHDQIMAWKFGPVGLLVSGRTGMSKTRFLFCAMHREHLAGRSCAFAAHIDFRREVSFLAQTDAVQMRRYLAVLNKADVVLFDDLGAGVITPAGEEAFEMMLSQRCRNGKPTLFSANAPETLPQRFSAERSSPILRRLAEFTEAIKL